jgi:hypothetical protein
MKKAILAGIAMLALTAMPVFAHHAAEGIVDEEIYEMIDTMVADTPHADLIFDDMGGGLVEISITTRTTQEMENLIEDGLLTYLGMLDGDVSLTIDFNVRSVEMTVVQQE